MGYKNAELRLGKNDTQLDDPRAGEVALRIDSTGAIFTKPEGAEEVAVVSAPAGVDGLGGAAGQVWTANGADSADWVAAKEVAGGLATYSAKIVAAAGESPTITTYFNTTGLLASWSRAELGRYDASLNGSVDNTKGFLLVANLLEPEIHTVYLASSAFTVFCYDLTTGAKKDGINAVVTLIQQLT